MSSADLTQYLSQLMAFGGTPAEARRMLHELGRNRPRYARNNTSIIRRAARRARRVQGL